MSCGGVEDDEDFSLSPNAISDCCAMFVTHTLGLVWSIKNHKFALRHETNREMTPQFVRYNFILHRRRIFYETKVVLINISEKSEKCFHVRPITLCAKKKRNKQKKSNHRNHSDAMDGTRGEEDFKYSGTKCKSVSNDDFNYVFFLKLAHG